MNARTHVHARASPHAVAALLVLLAVPATAAAHGLVGDFNPNRPAVDYLWLGAKHMLMGWDHLLFIAGVVLFASTMRSAAKLVSIFVLGHSITLMAATLAGWQIDPEFVDAIIALSLVYVGIQGILGKPANLRLTAAIVFAFGLVHGLGLSTRLQALGLPDDGLVWRVLLFNVGVELGQLAALLVIVGIVTVVFKLLKDSLLARRIAFGALALAGFIAAVVIAAGSIDLDDDGSTTKAAALVDKNRKVCGERQIPPPQPSAEAHDAKQFYPPNAKVAIEAFTHVIGHGYVIVRYRPDIDPEDIRRLKLFATRETEYASVSPDPKQKEPIRAITARTTLECTETDVAEVIDYHDRWLKSIGL